MSRVLDCKRVNKTLSARLNSPFDSGKLLADLVLPLSPSWAGWTSRTVRSRSFQS